MGGRNDSTALTAEGLPTQVSGPVALVVTGVSLRDRTEPDWTAAEEYLLSFPGNMSEDRFSKYVSKYDREPDWNDELYPWGDEDRVSLMLGLRGFREDWEAGHGEGFMKVESQGSTSLFAWGTHDTGTSMNSVDAVEDLEVAGVLEVAGFDRFRSESDHRDAPSASDYKDRRFLMAATTGLAHVERTERPIQELIEVMVQGTAEFVELIDAIPAVAGDHSPEGRLTRESLWQLLTPAKQYAADLVTAAANAVSSNEVSGVEGPTLRNLGSITRDVPAPTPVPMSFTPESGERVLEHAIRFTRAGLVTSEPVDSPSELVRRAYFVIAEIVEFEDQAIHLLEYWYETGVNPVGR